MYIGCFALVRPFTSIEKQFEEIANLGIRYVDLTDNHDGATLGTEYGFSASISLESNPKEIRQMLDCHHLTITSVCAHANLLDPTSPSRYGTAQIIKAIKLAHLLGVKQVITTEGDPKTDFGHNLNREQMLFSIHEKLYEPIQWAEELNIDLLIEPHGILTDSIDGMNSILDRLNSKCVGINLDTGNLWLGGGNPVDFIKHFTSQIKHVHWKDLGSEWIEKRGSLYGCGMGTLPLGDGVIGIKPIYDELVSCGFDGPTTLEVTGKEAVMESALRLKNWGA